MLDTKVKVFYESILCFMKMALKLYFMKCLERKISQCILPFRNFAKFTGKHLCQSLFFNKVAGLRPEVCFCSFVLQAIFDLKRHVIEIVSQVLLLTNIRSIWLELVWIQHSLTQCSQFRVPQLF